jgi:hypothetical protein
MYIMKFDLSPSDNIKTFFFIIAFLQSTQDT